MSATMREPSPWFSGPSRGAPFAGFLVLMVTFGAVIASGSIPFGSTLLVGLVGYLFLAGRWSHRLWASRWRNQPDRGAVPENVAFWGSFALMLMAAFTAQSAPVAAWGAFAAQVVVTAVIIPLTLRRYPGIA